MDKAIKVQRKRFQKEAITYNSQMNGTLVEKYCVLGRKEKELLKTYFETRKMSARGYHRILKVARTIADLAQSETITEIHLLEALSYRNCLNSRESGDEE